jgi:hypothetical protein
MKDTSPLLYALVRDLGCLNPLKIISEPRKTKRRFHRVLNVLVDATLVSPAKCDEITAEFSDFVENVSSNSSFSQESGTQRLDHLFFKSMADYTNLWNVVQMVLLLSHGQATVERGFSINKQVVEVNQYADSLVARRRIKDHVQYVGGLQSVVINEELITEGYQARRRYHENLEQKKVDIEKQKNAQKRKPIEAEIEIFSKRKRQLEIDCQTLSSDSVKALEKAEMVGNLSFLAKGNALRRSAKEKSVELEKVCQDLQHKENLLCSTLISGVTNLGN